MRPFIALAFVLTTAGCDTTGAVIVPLVRAIDYSAYFAKFHVGTPPQEELIEIDTGSPTISFENPRNNICAEASKPCDTYGYFVNTSSSTSKYVDSAFSDALIDFGSGDTLQDTVYLGDTVFTDLHFGYLNDYSFPDQVAVPTHTICGFALRCNDGQLDDSCYGSGYYLIPQLYDAGHINRRAVSFYLGPEDAHVNNSQMIIGGAYDRAKQGSTPFTVPMVPFIGQTNSVNASAVSYTIAGKGTRLVFDPLNVTLIDTGNPFLGLCDPVWDPVYAALGSPTVTDESGAYEVDCKYRDLPASDSIAVEFGSETSRIDVPLSSLVADLGNGSCVTFVQYNGPSSSGISLGDPFLRNTYVIFDDDNFTVTLAQAVHTTEQDIVPF